MDKALIKHKKYCNGRGDTKATDSVPLTIVGKITLSRVILHLVFNIRAVHLRGMTDRVSHSEVIRQLS